ncbi:hypothetical protein OSCT_2758 [Oscillochloris trichoides DG-6]|uniref:Glycosyltransferase RgtA/B/C/D-like domain-containing protein n=1 Tax=Oscillochloris trichoides DG-6 TaxID=765420 RepID=E1IHF7_9CHLR|nr:glycosyltransferase family 39 protein [Oscillochloris trichoides]EFO79410.1 hypothetical protein OSCT_2758 [Oscillochloris trichoides DG-6]
MRWQTVGALLLVFGACLGLYLLTLTDVHTYDALSYILDVDRKPWAELFHPHHLAYGPLGASIRSLALRWGWQGSAALLIQIANALAGAAGVTIFLALVRASGGNRMQAALGALLLAASYAFWYYAVEVEVYTIAALFLIVALGILLRMLERPTIALALGLGLVQGLAVLFHQTNVLLSIPALWVVWRSRGEVGSRWLRQAQPTPNPPRWLSLPKLTLLLAYMIPLGLIVAGAYLGVGLGVSGFRSWEQLYTWMTDYARTGWWGGAVDGNKLIGLARGLSNTLAEGPAGVLLGLGLLMLLLSSLRGLRQAPAGLVPLCLFWLVSYAAFFLWWEPENIEFWIASLPVFYLLLVMSLRDHVRLGLGIALAVAMLGLNWAAISARGDARNDLQRRIAEALAAQSGAGDLLVVPDGLLELYLPYYAQRENLTGLTQAMNQSGGDWVAACQRLQARVELTLASGYGVLLADDALAPQPAPLGEPPSMMERFGLRTEQVGACYAPLQAMMSEVDLGAGLPHYRRIANVQTLADGEGWDFRQGGWGWRFSQGEAQHVVGQGWRLVPGVDAGLRSPPMQIDPARVAVIEVRMAARTTNREAQIFFLDAQGQATEERSLRWRLAADADFHTYRLEVGAHSGWTGVIGGLRLDPVEMGDGGEVWVEEIRIFPAP